MELRSKPGKGRFQLHFLQKVHINIKTIWYMAKEEIKNPEVQEVQSDFIDGLLYGGYSVVSNKTVRAKEKFLVRWKNKDPNIPGKEMVKTNRGYFIDGYNVDERSTNLWFKLTKNNRNQKNPKNNETRKKSNRRYRGQNR